MGRKSLIGMIILLCKVLCAQGESVAILKELRARGGLATFELTVKDDQGAPVDGAEGYAAFWKPSGDEEKRALSDERGHLTLTGVSWVDGVYSVTKEGYYETRGRATFSAPDKSFGFFERRYWLPVVREVTLKKVRNPVPMYVYHRVILKMPTFEKPLALDLQRMDWVQPYGSGIEADVMISVEAEPQSYENSEVSPRKVTLTFVRAGDGAQLHEKDNSVFPTTYHAKVFDPFHPVLTLSFGKNGRFLQDTQYLVFRVRTELDENGTPKRAYYGKILGGGNIYFGDEIWLTAVYFNPTVNDTNLEFDPERNLVPKKELRRRRAMRP